MKYTDKKIVGQQNISVNVTAPVPSDDDASVDGGAKCGKYVKLGEKIATSINRASWKALAKFFTVIILAATVGISTVFAYRMANSDDFVNLVAKRINDVNIMEDYMYEDIRVQTVTPKIQKELEILCYSLGADRAFVFELHNGKKNATGLPFKFADMSYEQVNEENDIDRIAEDYQDIPLTLYKYPYYLSQQKYFYGDTVEISLVDDGFAKHVTKCGGKYLGMLYLNSNGYSLGFLCVSFHEKPHVSEAEIREMLEAHGKVITPLLDLSVQIKARKPDGNA